MAEGAALMTGTTWTSRILGAAWPQHMNKPVAEATFSNIQKVGLPNWSEDVQALARALPAELDAPNKKGLDTELAKLQEPLKDEEKRGGGSDDIGDISWNVPTITLRFPSNIPGLPGHSWANAVAMATPIAHKGVVSGAKVQAMTVLDLLVNPGLVKAAWDYFTNVQTRDQPYVPLVARDTPPIWLNDAVMAKYRPEMKKFYYDPSRYSTYLEQLGITDPTVRTTQTNPQPQR